MSRTAVVVGGGFSGTVQALQLLRHGFAGVTLIEQAGEFGRGLAYRALLPDHLLNVPAARMSAFPDLPGHFADFFARAGGAPDGFAPRRLYGDYLQGLLQAAGPQLQLVQGEAIDLAGTQLLLGDGRTVAADLVVLAPGNLPARPPLDLPARCWRDPWSADLAAGLGAEDVVLLIGTGLTAVDAVLSLQAGGFEGAILAVSRRGLWPRAHGMVGDAPPAEGRPRPLSCLLQEVRREALRWGWRAAVDQLRPVTRALWAGASGDERKRFLRHLRPYWDVHRHRIAPEIARQMARLVQAGRLEIRAGRIIAAEPCADGGAVIRWRPRGAKAERTTSAARIVNCTGPHLDITTAGNPLLDALLRRGRIRPDPLRIGIDVDAHCRALDAQGRASDTLHVIGPPTRGAFWEIVAVPDIRVQLFGLAQRLSA